MRFLLSLFIVFFCCNSAFAVDILTFDVPPYIITVDMDSAVVYNDRYNNKRVAIEGSIEKIKDSKSNIIMTTIFDFTDTSTVKTDTSTVKEFYYYTKGVYRRFRNTWELIDSYDGNYVTVNHKYKNHWMILDKFNGSETKIKMSIPELQEQFQIRQTYPPRSIQSQIYLLGFAAGYPKYLKENGY